MAAKLSQSEILRRLGYTPSKQLTAQLDGNGKLQQFINQQAALKGLPEPFDPSTLSAIIQDVLPLAAIAGAASALGTGAEGAAGGAVAGEGAAGGAAAGAAATGAVGATEAAGTAAVLVGVWEALTDPSNWLRGLEILGAAVAIYLGLRSLTGAPGVIQTAEKVKP